MRIYSGWDRNDPRLLDGANYLMQQQLPGDATPRERDTYYWYYATQVLKYIDGPLWNKWDSRLRPLSDPFANQNRRSGRQLAPL